MRILVDRFIYQGLRYAPSRHAARIRASARSLHDQDEKGSLAAATTAWALFPTRRIAE
jgi:hypothetical protein